MKKKNLILLVLFIISVAVNFYLFSELSKFKKADEKQLEIFTEVSDSLTYFRMQRDSIAHRQ